MILLKLTLPTEEFVYLIGRIVFGALFFFQAYDKIFRIKLKNVIITVSEGFREKGIKEGASKVAVYVSSYLELIGGFLIAFGLFTTPLLYIFGIHLTLIFIAFGFLQGLWDLSHVFPRFVILLLLLLLPQEWNVISLDHLFFCGNKLSIFSCYHF